MKEHHFLSTPRVVKLAFERAIPKTFWLKVIWFSEQLYMVTHIRIQVGREDTNKDS